MPTLQRIALETAQGLAREIAEADASHPLAYDYCLSKAQELTRYLEESAMPAPSGPLPFDPMTMLLRLSDASARVVRAQH